MNLNLQTMVEVGIEEVGKEQELAGMLPTFVAESRHTWGDGG